MLKQVCRTADLCEWLQAQLTREQGLPYSTGAHRTAAELRQQCLVFARLLAMLRLPAGLEADGGGEPVRAQRRGGSRGFYLLKGGRDAPA